MLIAVRRPAFALFVPVGFVAIGVGASVGSIVHLVDAPSAGGLFGVLVSLALLAFVLSLVRVMWRAGDALVVRGLPFTARPAERQCGSADWPSLHAERCRPTVCLLPQGVR